MDPHHWQKITNNSPTIFRINIKSETYMKCNRVHLIKACRDEEIIRTNLQENRCIFNQIRHIKAIGNKLISLPKKPPTLDNIIDVVKSPLGVIFRQGGRTILQDDAPQIGGVRFKLRPKRAILL